MPWRKRDDDVRHQTRLLLTIMERLKTMSVALDRLTAEVTETNTAIDSVLTLVAGLAEQIRENAEDPAKLNALADELDAKQQAIAAAIAANTPTPPEPPVEPAA
jgi:uncharacterized coiled-coil protein SlyX